MQQLLPESVNSSLFAQLLTVVLLIGVNLAGAKSSGRLQTVIALSIFALIAAFWWQGDFTSQDLVLPTVTNDSLWSIGLALGVMFWCFVGIEAFAHMGEEFKNPQRDFPIAIVVGCFVAGATYWICSIIVLKMGAYGTPAFDSASIPWISETLFGPEFKALISVVGFGACFASVNLYTQSLSRMVWAQAKEYSPDSALARLSIRGVPANATFAVGGVALVSCVAGQLSGLDLEFFLKLANGIFVLVYLLAMLAAYKLLTGFGRYLATISLVLCSVVFICLGWSMLYAVSVFALLSLPWKKWRTASSSNRV